MPRVRNGTRRSGAAGHLRTAEKEQLRAWLAEGCSVAEVWARCVDEGIDPPQETALYRILNEPETQSMLASAQAAGRARRIGRIADRIRQRQRLSDRLDDLVEDRAAEYGGFAPGGDTGLVVLHDYKIVGNGQDVPPDKIPIYKFDKAVVDSVLDLQREQAAEEERLRRNRRADAREAREIERHELDMDLTRVEAELLRKAMADAGDESGEGAEAGASGAEAFGQGPKIVVVDDHPPAPPSAP